MKKLSIKEKAKAYDKALEKAKEIQKEDSKKGFKPNDDVLYIFPELAESDDENIKSCIGMCLTDADEQRFKDFNTNLKDCLDWLKKQGEQKYDNKVQPMFNVGDWCIDNEDGTIFQIVKVLDNTYRYKTNIGKEYSCTHYSLENDAKLWTIQDAKAGDVLASDDGVCIFNGTLEEGMYPFAYCGITKRGFDSYDVNLPFSHDNNIHPSTREQRDILFQKMHEAGYEWDDEKKKLKKIGQIPANSAKTCKDAQNPAWSEDDEKLFNSALWHIKNSCGNGGKNSGEFEVYNWVKSIKDRVQPKQEWSEEDEKMLAEIVKDLQVCKSKDISRATKDAYQNEIDWLKSIKDRVQLSSKHEWSEEDKKMIIKICQDLYDYPRIKSPFDDESFNEAQKEVQFIKSLNPNSQWKPSEEQMKVLRYLDKDTPLNDFDKRVLHVLIGQLKKLREE